MERITMEELKEQETDRFLNHIRFMIKYWDSLPNKSSKEKMEGLAFSILVTLDGEASDLPAFIVAPVTYNDRRKVRCNISGGLHDLFSTMKTQNDKI